MSKFLSAFIAIATIIAVTFVYPVLVGIVTPGSFEWGPVMTSYFGLFLLAGAFAAIGLFFSSLTENQIIAAALCFVLLLLLWLVERFALGLSDGWLRQTVEFLSILGHLKNFFLGVVETKDIVYYLSVMFLGNSLAYLMVEGQRWR